MRNRLSWFCWLLPKGVLNKERHDFLALGHKVGYDDWALYVELLQRVTVSLLNRNLLQDAIRCLTLWSDSGEQASRYRHCRNLLKTFRDQNPAVKILAFAGYPGLAEELEIAVGSALGEKVRLSPFVLIWVEKQVSFR